MYPHLGFKSTFAKDDRTRTASVSSRSPFASAVSQSLPTPAFSAITENDGMASRLLSVKSDKHLVGVRGGALETIPSASTSVESVRFSVASSVAVSATDRPLSLRENPFAVKGDIHLVQCFPEGLFQLDDEWDVQGMLGLMVAFPDTRYNIFRRVVFETLPVRCDFPLSVSEELLGVLYDAGLEI